MLARRDGGSPGVTAADLDALAALRRGGFGAPRAERSWLCPQDRSRGGAPWLTTSQGQADMPGATGYLAEEMVTGVVAELLIGLRRDPVYGVTLTLGFGGTYGRASGRYGHPYPARSRR